VPAPCIVIATFAPKPEHYDEVKRVLLEVSPEVHLEEGCELYALHEEVGGALTFVEKWTSRDHWHRHGRNETVARIKGGVEGLLTRDIEVREMYGVESSGHFPESL
jgi:quinol monooxygenase YgiN